MQNSRGTFTYFDPIRKNEQTVKNGENQKKDYPRPGKRAIIYKLNDAYRQKGGEGNEADMEIFGIDADGGFRSHAAVRLRRDQAVIQPSGPLVFAGPASQLKGTEESDK